MPVILPPALPSLVFLPPASPFLVFLPLPLLFLVFLLSPLSFLVFLHLALPLLVFLLPISPPGPLNRNHSSPLFHFSLCFYSSPFSFIRFAGLGSVSHQYLNTYICYATPPSSFPMQIFRVTLLPLEKDYAGQYSISPLKTPQK